MFKKQIVYILVLMMVMLSFGACASGNAADSGVSGEGDVKSVSADFTGEAPQLPGLVYDHSMELLYANQFAVHYYENGYVLIDISSGGRFLLVPEGGDVPQWADIKVIQRPVENIYLAATAAMDYFANIDAMDCITLSGTKADGWYVDAAREAMEAGKISYAGKYNTPDYELILDSGCSLAIESSMIEHVPEVKEKLEKTGVNVMIDRSSYESHPLGRTEWIKLYGVLTGHEAEAQAAFDTQEQMLQQVLEETPTPSVAFFYITSSGSVNVRKSGDYVAKMIELAGGRYIFDEVGDAEIATGTANIQMEDFYAAAKDADYLVYNSTIDGELENLDALLAKSSLFSGFKAVKNGNVYCVSRNMFQETTGTGQMIMDLHNMCTGKAGDVSLEYLYKLK